MLHLGFNLLGLGILREHEHLLEFLVGEFAAEVATVMLFLVVFGLLFHVDYQVVVLVHMDLEVFFGETRSGVIFLFVLKYIDGRSGVVRPFHPAVVEEVVEDVRQPALISSNRR